MSVVCSNHNLAVLEDIVLSFQLHSFAFDVLSSCSADALANEKLSEWFGLLFQQVEHLAESVADLTTFEAYLRDEVDMKNNSSCS